MRPFRFLATVDGYPGFAELTSLARKAEAVGCSTFVLPDHLIGQYAAMPLLAVVAAATERLRVGTFVLNACLRHPAVLAQDLATLDVLSGGRLEIGLGAGWNKPEHDAIGVAFEPVGVRIKRLTEAITILKGCFAEGSFSFSGEHYTITGHDGAPKPAQRPHPPIFLGGGGKRLLALAAREAQIPHRRADGRHRRSARRGAPPRRPHPRADRRRVDRRGDPGLAACVHRQHQGPDAQVRGPARALRHQLIPHRRPGRAGTSGRGTRRTVKPVPDGSFRRQPPGRIRRIGGAGQHVSRRPLKAAVEHGQRPAATERFYGRRPRWRPQRRYCARCPDTC